MEDRGITYTQDLGGNMIMIGAEERFIMTKEETLQYLKENGYEETAKAFEKEYIITPAEAEKPPKVL